MMMSDLMEHLRKVKKQAAEIERLTDKRDYLLRECNKHLDTIERLRGELRRHRCEFTHCQYMAKNKRLRGVEEAARGILRAASGTREEKAAFRALKQALKENE
jgi:hypothetical protein